MDCPRCGAFCSQLDEYCECGFELKSIQPASPRKAKKRKKRSVSPDDPDAPVRARKKKRRKRRPPDEDYVQDDWLQVHRMSVFTMIVLTWVTCGFYVPYWYMKRQPFFDSLGSSTRLGSNLPIVAFVLAGIYDLMAFAPVLAGPQHSSQGLALLAELALGIVNLVLAFKGKQILLEASRETGPPVATSSLATFFFQAFYLQYCLNRISARARPRDVAHVFE